MADETKEQKPIVTQPITTTSKYPEPFASGKIEPGKGPGRTKITVIDGDEELTLDSPTPVVIARSLDNYFGGGLSRAAQVAKPFQGTS